MSELRSGTHRTKIDPTGYRLPDTSGVPRVPFSFADLALGKAKDLGLLVTIFRPRGVFITAIGGLQPTLDYTQFKLAGIGPDDDGFLIQIQFENVKYPLPTDGSDPAAGRDPVLAYGPLFPVFDFLKMCYSADVGQFHDYAAGLHGQPGMGGGGDATAGDLEVQQLMAAPAIKTALAEIISGGLPALPPADPGVDFTLPNPKVKGGGKNQE